MRLRSGPMLAGLREIAAELEYAQSRLLEIRTGIPFTPETKRALARADVARLEALYAESGRTPEVVARPVSEEWIVDSRPYA